VTQRDSTVNSPQKPRAIKSPSPFSPERLTLGAMTRGGWPATRISVYREIGARFRACVRACKFTDRNRMPMTGLCNLAKREHFIRIIRVGDRRSSLTETSHPAFSSYSNFSRRQFQTTISRRACNMSEPNVAKCRWRNRARRRTASPRIFKPPLARCIMPIDPFERKSRKITYGFAFLARTATHKRETRL